jgi:EF-hand domain pair
MRNRVLRTYSGGVLRLLVSLGTVQGCATNKSPLATASTVDREFAAAAVTWDLNRDGNVTCDEWKQYASDLFRAADANQDGVLTREEFAHLARQDRMFEVAGFGYFDADGDGQITLSEMVDKPNPAFALLDTNQDCIISPEERRGSDPKSAGKRKRGS